MLQIGVITKNTFGLEVAVMSQPKRNDDCILAVQRQEKNKINNNNNKNTNNNNNKLGLS